MFKIDLYYIIILPIFKTRILSSKWSLQVYSTSWHNNSRKVLAAKTTSCHLFLSRNCSFHYSTPKTIRSSSIKSINLFLGLLYEYFFSTVSNPVSLQLQYLSFLIILWCSHCILYFEIKLVTGATSTMPHISLSYHQYTQDYKFFFTLYFQTVSAVFILFEQLLSKLCIYK